MPPEGTGGVLGRRTNERFSHGRKVVPTKRSARLVTAIGAVLLAYLAVVAYRIPVAGKELLPVFNWELFSKVPPRDAQDYGIRLTEVDGRRLVPPVYFEEAGAYIPASHSVDAQQLIQQFGRRVDAKSLPQAAYVQSILETRFLQPLHGLRYELVRRRFDLIDRIDCRCFNQQVVVGSFTRR